jgi:hypothetical protein
VASSDGDYCRAKADECRLLAKGVPSADVKATLLKLEQRWLEEAAEADAMTLRSSAGGKFNDGVKLLARIARNAA